MTLSLEDMDILGPYPRVQRLGEVTLESMSGALNKRKGVYRSREHRAMESTRFGERLLSQKRSILHLKGPKNTSPCNPRQSSLRESILILLCLKGSHLSVYLTVHPQRWSYRTIWETVRYVEPAISHSGAFPSLG